MKDEILKELQSDDIERIALALKELNKMEYIPMRYEKLVLKIFESGVLRNTGYMLDIKEKVISQSYNLTGRQKIRFEDDYMDSIWNKAGYMEDFDYFELSEGLLVKCNAWQDEYDEKYSCVYEPDTSDELIEKYHEHIKVAFELMKEIKKEVKSRYEVEFSWGMCSSKIDKIYYFCLDKGILRDEWDKPVLLHELCELVGIKSDDGLERELCELGEIIFNANKYDEPMDIKELNIKMERIASKIEKILPENVVFECFFV